MKIHLGFQRQNLGAFARSIINPAFDAYQKRGVSAVEKRIKSNPSFKLQYDYCYIDALKF